MTGEEAIKKASDKLNSIIYLSECSANSGLRKAYGNMADWFSRVVYLAEVGLKAQQEADKNEPLTLMSEWISVKDRLPENEGRCIVYDMVLGVQVYYYHPDMICSGWSGVTHWMPMPAPPQEEGEAHDT